MMCGSDRIFCHYAGVPLAALRVHDVGTGLLTNHAAQCTFKPLACLCEKELTEYGTQWSTWTFLS
eukprot:4230153-Amphidinium_carterae.1